MESLISTYGYVAVLLGTFLEGETILVLAGFAAHRGYLELPWVIVAAFFGTLIGDQLFFYLGRLKGIDWIERRPAWKLKASRVFVLVENHETLIILTFRFLYGLRTVTPFVLGLSGVRAVKYFILNIIGAALWAVSVGVLSGLVGSLLAEKSQTSERRRKSGRGHNSH